MVLTDDEKAMLEWLARSGKTKGESNCRFAAPPRRGLERFVDTGNHRRAGSAGIAEDKVRYHIC
jgi:hypothetical protein